MTFRQILLATAPLFTAVLTSAPAYSQNDEVLRGPVPDWVLPIEALDVPEDARGIVFLRRQQTQIHLTEDASQTYYGSHVRLLHPQALQLGNIALTWNPSSGSPVVHALRIHRGDEVIDVLESHDFEILRREDQLELAWLDGRLTATLQVADLRVGDELELAFTLPTTNPTLKDKDSGLMTLAHDPAPGRIQLALSWEDGAEPATQLTQDLEEFTRRTANALVIETDLLGPLNAPRNAPPRYNWLRVLEYSDFASWPAISQRFHGLFNEARQLQDGSDVAKEAARIARQHDSEMDRAKAALDLVTQQVRYIFVGLNTGALTPATAEETWERRYGDCKGKTALLLALLDEMGIAAEAVLVSNAGIDDGLIDRLPNPGMFDHVLVRAMIDGKAYWLDGTYPGVAVPTEEPLPSYSWVLPLSAEGTAPEELPWQALQQPTEQILYEIDAREGFDVSARVRQVTISRGADALNDYLRFSAVTDSQLETVFRNQLAGTAHWDTIDSVTWRFDEEHQAGVLEIVGTGPVDWDDKSMERKSLSLPGGGFVPPQRRMRDSQQDQNAPFFNDTEFSCHVTTVYVPGDTEPEQWSYNSTFEDTFFGREYRRQFERRGDSLRMIRSSRTTSQEIAPKAAADDNARLDDFDNSKAVITFDPFDFFEPDEQQSVPAVSEVDWVNDFSACATKAEREK